jgi:hypothetical protein
MTDASTGAAHEITTDEVGREEGSDYLAQIIALIAACSAGFWAVAKLVSEQMLRWMDFIRSGKQSDREFELKKMLYDLKAQEVALKERSPDTGKIIYVHPDHYDEFTRRVREL